MVFLRPCGRAPQRAIPFSWLRLSRQSSDFPRLMRPHPIPTLRVRPDPPLRALNTTTSTPRNQMQEPFISVQLVPGMQLLVLDFGVSMNL
eukprot:785729-Rhodomonas_salina.1